MRVPAYEWRCHKCQLVNRANVGACAGCGFPAVATAMEISGARQVPSPVGEGDRALAREERSNATEWALWVWPILPPLIFAGLALMAYLLGVPKGRLAGLTLFLLVIPSGTIWCALGLAMSVSMGASRRPVIVNIVGMGVWLVVYVALWTKGGIKL